MQDKAFVPMDSLLWEPPEPWFTACECGIEGRGSMIDNNT